MKREPWSDFKSQHAQSDFESDWAFTNLNFEVCFENNELQPRQVSSNLRTLPDVRAARAGYHGLSASQIGHDHVCPATAVVYAASVGACSGPLVRDRRVIPGDHLSIELAMV